MADRIQLRRGDFIQWNSNLTEVLSDGELSVVDVGSSKYLILGNGTDTILDILGLGSIYHIPIFKTVNPIFSETIGGTNTQKEIDFTVVTESGSPSSSCVFKVQGYSEFDTSSSVATAEYEVSSASYGPASEYAYSKLYVWTTRNDNIYQAEASLSIEVENSSTIGIFFNNDGNGAYIRDTVYQQGLGDISNYSLNKGPNSYITQNWLRSLSGYNDQEIQMLVNSTGVFIWQTI